MERKRGSAPDDPVLDKSIFSFGPWPESSHRTTPSPLPLAVGGFKSFNHSHGPRISFRASNSALSSVHTVKLTAATTMVMMSQRATLMALPLEFIDHILTFLSWPHDHHRRTHLIPQHRRTSRRGVLCEPCCHSRMLLQRSASSSRASCLILSKIEPCLRSMCS